ncbi:MAG TPA: toll/interleukin-1 receptor domain-containing protein [Hyphomicrobiaceae bacterium]|nr:toll/interleukin-1 receptor domain-containing protein [Hyphomicrobiaceae bacterium]
MAKASSSGGNGRGVAGTPGSMRRQAIRAAARGPVRVLRHGPEPRGPAVPPLKGRGGAQSQRIFISYSHQDFDIVRGLVARLRSGGASVDWDQDFIGGEDFDQAIVGAIEAARCVIVVWSPASVLSPYVRDEARRAQRASKLITTYVAGFDLADVPLGFGSLHAIPVDDATRLRASLAARGIALKERDP